MTGTKDNRIGRRPVLKGTGASLAALGGLASPVAARPGGRGQKKKGQDENRGRGGKTPLNDRPADIMLYWSIGSDPDGNGPNKPPDFGYPGPFDPMPPGGLFLVTHDDKEGSFDFSKINMTPNGGTLHNVWTFFYGLLLASKPKEYPLVHQGEGVYESRGQVMRFDAQESDGIGSDSSDIDFLRYPDVPDLGPLAGKLFPPVEVLEGESWRAVGAEKAVLALDENDQPTPDPEIAATRIDFYTAKKPVYTLSLLYLIWYSENPDPDPIPGLTLPDGTRIPPVPGDVHSLAMDLITRGRLNPSGQ